MHHKNYPKERKALGFLLIEQIAEEKYFWSKVVQNIKDKSNDNFEPAINEVVQ